MVDFFAFLHLMIYPMTAGFFAGAAIVAAYFERFITAAMLALFFGASFYLALFTHFNYLRLLP